MKQILKSEDYDSYKILLPAGHMFGKRKQLYLYQELEKRHPCFSENFAYDVSSRLTGKGILCNVTVMDKTVLGLYKADFPKDDFFTEEKEKVFKRKKQGWFYFTAGVLILFSAGLLYKNVIDKTRKNPVEEEPVPEIKEIKQIPESITGNLFMDTVESDGKIQTLFWSYDGFSEKVSMELTDCFPSDFDFSSEKMEIKFSPVSFKDQRETFSLEAWKKTGDVVPVKNRMADSRKKFFSGINKWFSENGITVLSEDYSSGKITLVKPENLRERFFAFSREMNLLFSEVGFSLHEIRINEKQMEMVFTDAFEIPFSANIFESLSEINPVFYRKPVPEEKKKKVIPKTENKITPDRKKIGIISHERGSSTTFYKNQKGKIENE